MYMPNYLSLQYPEDEYGPDKYPQKLCDYLTERFFLNKEMPSNKLLDIGSGKGNALVCFSRNGFDVKGIDKRNECINILSDFDTRESSVKIQL